MWYRQQWMLHMKDAHSIDRVHIPEVGATSPLQRSNDTVNETGTAEELSYLSIHKMQRRLFP